MIERETGKGFTMHTIKLDVIDTCPKTDGKDVFLISDNLSGFVERAHIVPQDNPNRKQCTEKESWTGKQSYDTALNYARNGDLSGVPASDAFLSRFESLHAARPAWARVADVIGSSAIISAAINGHPLSMRRRVRVASENAPLAVCVDLVSSGGIDAKILRKRGALILALVRALSALRPVELWCGGSSLPFDQEDTFHVWWRMDTSPLDLARAAHVMTSPAFSRGLLYGVVSDAAKSFSGLRWPYNNHYWSRANMRPVLSRVIGSGDMLCIAAPHAADRLVDEPEAWFSDMLKQYGGLDDEA